jgi:hypothetical protein
MTKKVCSDPLKWTLAEEAPIMIDLNHCRNLAARKRANYFHVPFLLSVLEAALERQSLIIFGWLIFATPVAVQAQFNYTITDGTVTITGYTGSGGVVVIPDTITGLPVTAIDFLAFARSTNLTSVTIPNTVTTIRNAAFSSCTRLTNVTIPNSVTNIGDNAFVGCKGLTNVTMGNGVLNIGWSAFAYDDNLTSVTMGNGVRNIMESAFMFCINLISVTIPNSVTNIGDIAFLSCSNLTSVTIGNGVPHLGENVFADCTKLTNVTIPNSVTSIRTVAFHNCSSLTNVAIPNSVTNIGEGAFDGCISLTRVTIPNSVTLLAMDAFGGCPNLAGVYFQGNAPFWFPHPFPKNATAYYLPGTTGWDSTFGGIPTALWSLAYPVILTSNPSFGMRSNQIGFTISWATNLSVVVEAATDLANPVWSPLATNTLPGGWFYFNDPEWTNNHNRFYRVRSH